MSGKGKWEPIRRYNRTVLVTRGRNNAVKHDESNKIRDNTESKHDKLLETRQENAKQLKSMSKK